MKSVGTHSFKNEACDAKAGGTLEETSSVQLLIREVLLAGGMIGILIFALYAHTGSMPPLVVVESSSMIHAEDGEVGSIDAGDLVLVHDTSIDSLVTFAEATDKSHRNYGYESHGMEGDVVIYKKNGEATTPIIHRAILRVIPNEVLQASNESECSNDASFDSEWIVDGKAGACVYTWDVPGTNVSNVTSITLAFDGVQSGYYDCDRMAHAGVEEYLVVEDWVPAHSGLLTLGDANQCSVDQGSAAVKGSSGLRTNDGSTLGPVQESWIVGRAGGEIPWLGSVKLMVSGSGPGLEFVPSSSMLYLFLCIGGILLIPMIIDPAVRKLFMSSPEYTQAKQEEGLLFALGITEEE